MELSLSSVTVEQCPEHAGVLRLQGGDGLWYCGNCERPLGVKEIEPHPFLAQFPELDPDADDGPLELGPGDDSLALALSGGPEDDWAVIP